jgi:hypothetical protein
VTISGVIWVQCSSRSRYSPRVSERTVYRWLQRACGMRDICAPFVKTRQRGTITANDLERVIHESI